VARGPPPDSSPRPKPKAWPQSPPVARGPPPDSSPRLKPKAWPQSPPVARGPPPDSSPRPKPKAWAEPLERLCGERAAYGRPARHRGFEPLTYGSGVGNEALARFSSGLQIVGIPQVPANDFFQPTQPLAPNRSPFGPMVVQEATPRSASASRRPRVRAPDGGSGARLLSVREVAQRLGVCTAIVYRLIESGTLPHVRVSNAIRVEVSKIDAYMKRRSR
jgi:excisionase family DNA binding protein